MGGVVTYNAMGKVFIVSEKEFGMSRKEAQKQFESLEPLADIGRLEMDEFWKRLAVKLKIKDSQKLRTVWGKAFEKSANLNPAVVRIVKRIGNPEYKIALLSNTMTSHAVVHARRGHYKLFPKVFLSHKIHLRKPNLGSYRYVARKLHVKTNECIFIDDKPMNIAGARKAGMKAILFKTSSQLGRDLKKYGIQ